MDGKDGKEKKKKNRGKKLDKDDKKVKIHCTRAKGPGFYTGIGQRTRALLYNGYQNGHKFTITTYSPTGVSLTSAGRNNGDLFSGDVNIHLKNKNVTTNFRIDTSSNLFATVIVNEPLPGLKAIVSFKVPDQRSGRLQLRYLNDYAGITTSSGLPANPIVHFSGVLGTSLLALGAEVSFDTKSRTFTKCNAGLSFTKSDLIASLTLNNKGDTLSASYYHTVRAVTRTVVGAEVTQSFSTNKNTITVGYQHVLDKFTSFKACVNNYGKACGMIQHEWRPKSFFTISAQVNTKSIEKSAKFGLALSLKP